MLVETYEVNEQSTEGLEDISSPESIALIEKLGLEGQRSLVETVELGHDEVVFRNPYRFMTSEEQNVYMILFPVRTSIESYSSGPIPLRVLQVADHAKRFFSRIEVWHPKDAREKDPVLVGYETNQWTSKPMILARWGESLDSLEQLKVKAAQKLRPALKLQIEKARIKLDGLMTSLDNEIAMFLNGDRSGSEYVSLNFSTEI